MAGQLVAGGQGGVSGNSGGGGPQPDVTTLSPHAHDHHDGPESRLGARL